MIQVYEKKLFIMPGLKFLIGEILGNNSNNISTD